MLKVSKIFIFFIVILLVFTKQIISYSSLYFFSKWIDREVTVDAFQINYKQSSIMINNIKIKNPNKFYYDYIFKSEKIALNIDLKSLLFSNLVIIDNLTFKNPKFFLEIFEKKRNLSKDENSSLAPITYDDNIGLAKKISENTPDKIWPVKKKTLIF